MEKYKKLRRIGQGSFGRVYLVMELSTRREFVMKRIPIAGLEWKDVNLALQEAQILHGLKHPNIVGYHNSFFHSEKQEICIVMDFCQEGDIKTYFEREKGLIDEKTIVNWFVQILLALKYIHSRKILHRDLKTQNIFLTKNLTVKIGDFGISKFLNKKSEMAETVVGTPYYMSPEQLERKPYSYFSDIWSVGCCLYEIASKQKAFHAKNISDLLYKVKNERPPELPSSFSQVLRSAIHAMLDPNPEKRPAVDDMLQYPFVKNAMRDFIQSSNGRVDVRISKKLELDPNIEKKHLNRIAEITHQSVPYNKIEDEFAALRSKQITTISKREKQVKKLENSLDTWKLHGNAPKNNSQEHKRIGYNAILASKERKAPVPAVNVRDRLKHFRRLRIKNEWEPVRAQMGVMKRVNSEQFLSRFGKEDEAENTSFEAENEATKEKVIQSKLMVEQLRLQKLNESLSDVNKEHIKFKEANNYKQLLGEYSRTLEQSSQDIRTPKSDEDTYFEDTDDNRDYGVTGDRITHLHEVLGEQSFANLLSARRKNEITSEQMAKFLGSNEGDFQLKSCIADIETILLLEDNLL